MQAVADAAALAAENEVAEFVIAVRVADATLLSMSLTGLSLVGVGTACCCTPPTAAAGKGLIETGKNILVKRDDVARAAEKALSAAQEALPAVSQVQAQAVIQENAASLSGASVGFVELVPGEGEPLSVGTSSASLDAADAAQGQSDAIASAAEEASAAREEAQEALEQGFLHDCGNAPGYCMYERADTVAQMPSELNPLCHSVNTWSFDIALKRAQAYYPYRTVHERPENESVEECARSALRKNFYEFASEEVARGHALDDGNSVPDIVFPLLPKNTSEMKKTALYTDKAYPAAGGCLHAWDGCPEAQGRVEGLGSLAEQDAGLYGVCGVCELDSVALGKVASASSSIENGFEYHYRKVAEAAEAYTEALGRAFPAESAAKDATQGIFDRIAAALDELGSCRIEAYPPGRFGSLAAVTFDAQDQGDFAFFGSSRNIGSFAATSSAVLAEDASENVFSSLLDGVVDDIGPPLSDAGPTVLSLWGSLIEGYSSGTEVLVEGVESLLESVPLIGSSGLGSWAAESLVGMIESAGLEPANTESPKPFIANTEHVAERGSGPVASAIATLKGS